MKLLNLIGALALGLSLSGCKQIDFEDVVSFEGTCNQEDETSADCDIKIYTGATDSIEYFDGGWYPAPNQPNYRAKLLLEVKSNTLVAGHLETPKCKAIGEVSVLDYAKLDQLIRSSKKGISPNNGIVDAGDEVLTVTRNNEETQYFLKNGDHSGGEIIIKDPAPVRDQVNSIIKSLEEKHCDDVVQPRSDLVTLIYDRLYSPNTHAGEASTEDRTSPPIQSRIATVNHLKMSFQNGRVYMSVQANISSPYENCTQNLAGEGPAELKELASLVRIENSNIVCDRAAIWPAPPIQQVSLYYKGKSQPEVGYLGCEQTKQVRNFAAVLKKVEAWTLSRAICDKKVQAVID